MIDLEKFLVDLPGKAAKLKYSQVILGEEKHPKRIKKSVKPPEYLPGANDISSFFETVFPVSGKMVMSLNGMNYLLEPGDACIVKYAVRHFETYYKKNTPYELVWVHYSPIFRILAISASYNPSYGYKILSTISMDVDPKTVRHLDEIYELPEPEKNFKSVKDNLKKWLEYISQKIKDGEFYKRVYSEGLMRERALKAKRISKSIEFIKKNYRKRITLKQVADESGLNPSYFGSLFDDVFNYEPLKYVKHLRLRDACNYLRTTEMPIREIGLKVGYENQFFFSRLFKKYFGITPKEYRRRQFSPPGYISSPLHKIK